MAEGLLRIAVAGAHLSGLALNHQVLDLGAKLVKACRTAPVYRMYSIGPKPSLIRQPEGSTTGASIEVELWDFPIEKVGCGGAAGQTFEAQPYARIGPELLARICRYFLRDGVKAPLCLGDLLLEDSSTVKGFLGESYAVIGAEDITHFGGWRAYLASKQ
jgi:allophanate hydrolase